MTTAICHSVATEERFSLAACISLPIDAGVGGVAWRVAARTPSTRRSTLGGEECPYLRDELVLIGELTGLLLRVDLSAIKPDLEDAARTWHQADPGKAIRVIVRDLFRQTGGFLEITSSGAVFDLEFHHGLLRTTRSASPILCAIAPPDAASRAPRPTPTRP